MLEAKSAYSQGLSLDSAYPNHGGGSPGNLPSNTAFLSSQRAANVQECLEGVGSHCF